ncbi:MAG: hypothetical protein RBS39_04020 [Phycisphaerales bacterium]|nr:hypothetical protein [Phycisphaerales bacterium]
MGRAPLLGISLADRGRIAIGPEVIEQRGLGLLHAHPRRLLDVDVDEERCEQRAQRDDFCGFAWLHEAQASDAIVEPVVDRLQPAHAVRVDGGPETVRLKHPLEPGEGALGGPIGALPEPQSLLLAAGITELDALSFAAISLASDARHVSPSLPVSRLQLLPLSHELQAEIRRERVNCLTSEGRATDHEPRQRCLGDARGLADRVARLARSLDCPAECVGHGRHASTIQRYFIAYKYYALS